MEAKFNELWDITKNDLNKIWNDMGLTDREKETKLEKAYNYIEAHFDKLKRREEKEREILQTRVLELGRKVFHIYQLLHNRPKQTDPGDKTLIEMESYLKNELKILQDQAEARNKQFFQLQKQEWELCSELCEDKWEFKEREVRSASDIDQLKKIISTLKDQKIQRKRTLESLRSSIKSNISFLKKPLSILERQIVYNPELVELSLEKLHEVKELSHELEDEVAEIRNNFEKLKKAVDLLYDRLAIPTEDRLMLSGDVVDDSHRLEKEKARLQEIRKQNMTKFITQLRQELKDYWNKCYVSQEEREAFQPFYADSLTEEILQEHENELERLRQLYGRNAEIYAKLDNWTQLWNEVVELEEKSKNNDPSRYSNRGGTLLQEEQKRKRVRKQLPKVEKALRDHLNRIEEETGVPFLVCGLGFDDYIESKWKNYNAQKLKEKQDRQHARTEQIRMEARLGTKKPSLKRGISMSNLTHSSKFMRTAINTRTPMREKISTGSSSSNASSKFGNKLTALRESNRKEAPIMENTLESSTISSYVKFSEHLKARGESENVNSSVLHSRARKPDMNTYTPRTHRTPSQAFTRNAMTVPRNFAARRSSRLNPSIQASPSAPSTGSRQSRTSRLTSRLTAAAKSRLNFLM